jgi:hypothetical protein
MVLWSAATIIFVAAEVLRQHLAFASDQFVALDRKASELEREIGKLDAELQREKLDRDKAQQELQRLKDEHEEETAYHDCILFRRGKSTQNKWMGFCPKCKLPLALLVPGTNTARAYCTDTSKCGWATPVPMCGNLTLLGNQINVLPRR